MTSLLKELAGAGIPTMKDGKAPKPNLKNSDASDAGKWDVAGKAGADDVSFSLMRNTINSDGELTGSEVANYLERAAELNDEVDSVPFGLETDDGDIVKVYVNAEQADKFEAEMQKMLGLEDDIEEAINKLAQDFDIIDVVWPETDDGVDVESDSTAEFDGLSDEDEEDEMEVVGEFEPLKEGVILDDSSAYEFEPREYEAFEKLENIVENLRELGTAGVSAATGLDKSEYTKHEMIVKYVQDKYAAEVSILKKAMTKSNISEEDQPFWLR